MGLWQNFKERRRRRRAEWAERTDLVRRAVAALARMGTLEANADIVDLVILRCGVHLLEANARFGPLVLVPMQPLQETPEQAQAWTPDKGSLH